MVMALGSSVAGYLIGGGLKAAVHGVANRAFDLGKIWLGYKVAVHGGEAVKAIGEETINVTHAAGQAGVKIADAAGENAIAGMQEFRIGAGNWLDAAGKIVLVWLALSGSSYLLFENNSWPHILLNGVVLGADGYIVCQAAQAFATALNGNGSGIDSSNDGGPSAGAAGVVQNLQIDAGKVLHTAGTFAVFGGMAFAGLNLISDHYVARAVVDGCGVIVIVGAAAGALCKGWRLLNEDGAAAGSGPAKQMKSEDQTDGSYQESEDVRRARERAQAIIRKAGESTQRVIAFINESSRRW